MKTVLDKELVWYNKDYKLEISKSRLSWKVKNKNDVIISKGFSLDGRPIKKEDVEKRLEEIKEYNTYFVENN